MIVEQHYLGCLSQASYLIADEVTRTAFVVDPRRDVDLYLERAEALGVEIRHVLLTHFHADFLAGHLELAERTGATIHLGAAAQAEYTFEPLADGDTIEVGDVRIEALATPGHTPESTCYVLHDLAAEGDRPHAVMTGDTLFIGDVGRPDLMASVGVTKEELASELYDSLREKLLALPDETILYPGHGAGSACGKALSTETVSTIGAQRAGNYALQPMSRAEFVAAVTSEQPPAPAYFPRAAGLNKITHDLLGDVLAGALASLDADQALSRMDQGATLLDVRPAEEFAAAHLAGSIWIGLDGRFAGWAGTLLDLEAPIVIVGGEDLAREAALRLARVGLDQVTGFLGDVDGAMAAHPALVRSLRRLEPAEAAGVLGGEDAPLVVDVRTKTEHEDVRLDGALSLPLAGLRGLIGEIPADRSLVLHCKSGYRSLAAISLLLHEGLAPDSMVDVLGGIDRWSDEGLPIIGTGCTAP